MTVMPQPADSSAMDATTQESASPVPADVGSSTPPVMTPVSDEAQTPRPASPRPFQPGHQDVGRIAQDLQIRKIQVEAVAQLLDEGYAVPYMARFCKDRIGFLNEDVIRQVQRRILLLRQVSDRKQAILRNLQTQGKLTDELQAAIQNADTNKRLEDLYLPYKPRKKSPTASWRDKGLEPLALAIWQRDPAVQNLDELWPTFINPEKELATAEVVQEGVRILIAEAIGETAAVRETARRYLWEHAKWRIERAASLPEGQGLEFKDYFNFSDSIRHIAPHRVFTILRGEKSGALTIHLDFSWEQLEPLLLEKLHLADHPHQELVSAVAVQGLRQFLIPSLEKEIRRDLMDKAEEYGLQVYARNFRRLLMQPPVHKSVLAIDPGYRNGCRLAALDAEGHFLTSAVIFPMAVIEREKKDGKKAKGNAPLAAGAASAAATATPAAQESAASATASPSPVDGVKPSADAQPASTETPAAGEAGALPAMEAVVPEGPQPEKTEAAAPAPPSGSPSSPPPPAGPTPEEQRAEAKRVIVEMVRKHQLQVAAIGSGMGSRDVEELLSELIANELPDFEYHVVMEAGANAYALGSVGREEFPHQEVAVRAAITIGRRLQDPLREFAKLDPVHVSTGLAHYDLAEKRLKEALTAVLESCINHVGVHLNRATVHELKYVAGLNPILAQAIVHHRQQQGPFLSREGLKQVPGMNDLAYRQAAAFVRVPDAENILDRTWVHPEQAEIVHHLLAELGASLEALTQEDQLERLRQKFAELNLDEYARKYQLSAVQFDDLLHALARPGKDPRMDQPAPLMKKKLLKLEDMYPGMELKGTVLNVVDFGAFVDVGLKDSGLVHISQLANKYIKSPYDHVSVGDVATVWVMNVDMDRKRVSLTMIPPGTDRKPAERKPAPAQRERREAPSDRGQRPPKPRYPAQVASPGKPSAANQLPPPPPRSGGRPPSESGSRAPVRYTQPPRKPKPPPKLSEEALKGSTPLRTFSELKALYEAKKPGSEPASPPAPTDQVEAPALPTTPLKDEDASTATVPPATPEAGS